MNSQVLITTLQSKTLARKESNSHRYYNPVISSTKWLRIWLLNLPPIVKTSMNSQFLIQMLTSQHLLKILAKLKQVRINLLKIKECRLSKKSKVMKPRARNYNNQFLVAKENSNQFSRSIQLLETQSLFQVKTYLCQARVETTV